jgi:hypothetical protein
MVAYSTELGIRLSFVKTSEFLGGGLNPPKHPTRYATACLYFNMQLLLTYAMSGTRSERHVSKWLYIVLVVFTEAIWIIRFRIREKPWVMMQTIYWYIYGATLLQLEITTRYMVVFHTFAANYWCRRIHS